MPALGSPVPFGLDDSVGAVDPPVWPGPPLDGVEPPGTIDPVGVVVDDVGPAVPGVVTRAPEHCEAEDDGHRGGRSAGQASTAVMHTESPIGSDERVDGSVSP